VSDVHDCRARQRQAKLARGPSPTLMQQSARRSPSLIREHLRTTRNLLAPSFDPLKSAYAKLAPGDDPPPTPRLKQQPLGLRQRWR
jgi:hypothetical protein